MHRRHITVLTLTRLICSPAIRLDPTVRDAAIILAKSWSSDLQPTPSTRTRAGKYSHKLVQPASLDSAAGANATNADRAVDAPARVPRGRAHCGAGWERR